eukprot:UN09593
MTTIDGGEVITHEIQQPKKTPRPPPRFFKMQQPPPKVFDDNVSVSPPPLNGYEIANSLSYQNIAFVNDAENDEIIMDNDDMEIVQIGATVGQ